MIKKLRNLKKSYHALASDAWINIIIGFGFGLLVSSLIF